MRATLLPVKLDEIIRSLDKRQIINDTYPFVIGIGTRRSFNLKDSAEYINKDIE
jgi:hypothetical protein